MFNPIDKMKEMVEDGKRAIYEEILEEQTRFMISRLITLNPDKAEARKKALDLI